MSPGSDTGRTFAIDVGSPAAASLQKVIFTKLTEFIGDYTDEILAQYILVLVAHGKHKMQAMKDLEAFLGDRSEDFVSWLWDYLCTNVQPQSSISKVESRGSSKRREDTVKEGHGAPLIHEHETQMSKMDTILREKGLPEWNDHAIEDNAEKRRGGTLDDETSSKARHASKRLHMRHHAKKHELKNLSDVECHKRHLSMKRVNATRRLLQSAVWDAVAPAVVHVKSGAKRLRSVVSTEIDGADILEDTSKKQLCKDLEIDMRQAEVVASQVSQAMNGDAKKDTIIDIAQRGGSVWDRLGKINDNRKNGHAFTESKNSKLACSSVTSDSDRMKGQTMGIQERISIPIRKQKQYENGQTFSPASINEGQYHMDIGTNSRVLAQGEVSQHLGIEDQTNKHRDECITVKYKLGEDVDQDLAIDKPNVLQPGSRSCHREKFLNISVNLNASQSFEMSNRKGFPDHQIRNQESSISTSQCLHDEAAIQQDYPNYCHQDIIELKNKIERVQFEMMKLRANRTQGTDKSCKVHDASNKPTVFVTNIHFAASKDAVKAHFAQCGDIANVVMLTDGATGQPKGAAYVEFYMQKAADKALSLNDTSFYSRILKVVRKNDAAENSIAHPNSVMRKTPSRGRISRGLFSKFTRRGNPVKLQWRRETMISTGTSQVNGKKLTPMARSYSRSFSYIRNNSVPGTTEGNTLSKLSVPVVQKSESGK